MAIVLRSLLRQQIPSLSEELLQECRIWLKLAFFNGMRSLSELLPWIISLVFVGKVSVDELAALSLAETWLYSFMLVNWIGSEMTQSTLVSQAHGQRSIIAMRGWTLISFITMSILNIFIAALALSYVPVLLALHFDHETVLLGEHWAYLSIPVLFTEAFVICSSNYLVSSQIYWQPTVVELVRIFIDAPLSYIFIFGCGREHFGRLDNPLVGCAVAWLIGSLSSCILNCVLVRYYWNKELQYGHIADDASTDDVVVDSDCTKSTLKSSLLDVQFIHPSDYEVEANGKINKADNYNHSILRTHENSDGLADATMNTDATMSSVLQWALANNRIRSHGYLALPNLFFAFTFCFNYFVLAILAAKLGNTILCAHNLCISLFHVIASISAGMGEATSVRVGFHVGCGDIPGAKRVTNISILFGMTWGVILCISMYLLRHVVTHIMVGNSDVQSQMLSIIPIMSVSYVVVTISDMSLAILEGQGRASEQALSFCIGTWIVGVTLALISFFCTNLGLVGIWLSSLAGNIVTLVLASHFVTRSNWSVIIAESKERIDS